MGRARDEKRRREREESQLEKAMERKGKREEPNQSKKEIERGSSS